MTIEQQKVINEIERLHQQIKVKLTTKKTTINDIVAIKALYDKLV